MNKEKFKQGDMVYDIFGNKYIIIEYNNSSSVAISPEKFPTYSCLDFSHKEVRRYEFELYKDEKEECECKNLKAIDVWVGKVEDKNSVNIGKIVKFYKKECQDCGNIILEEEILNI